MSDSNFESSALYRNGILVLLLVSVALIVHNIFGHNGYLALRQQQKELKTLEQQLDQLKRDNEQLDKENRDLKTNPAAIERQAREHLGLVDPRDKVYIRSGTPPADPAPPAPDKQTAPQP